MPALTSGRRWGLEAAPWWRVGYAVILAAIVAALLASATGPPPLPVPVTQSFAHRWDGVPRVIPLPSRPVQTIPIPPDPPMEFVEEASPQASAVPAKPRQAKAPATDVCRGRGKIFTKGGKSWRCRR